MNEHSLLLIAVGFTLYAAFSGRLSRTILTAPFLFALAGLALGDAGLGVLDLKFEHHFVDMVAEFTLLLVLFTDASSIDLRKLRTEISIPSRLLLIGMPLAIAAGTFFALWLPLGLQPLEAALLAAILAPTDAALGQAVVTSPTVPERLRRALNVESGLNDGIALPIVLLFAALSTLDHGASMDRNWVLFTGGQLILGPLVGIVVGYVGAKLFDATAQRGWTNVTSEGAGAIGLAVACFLSAEMIGGNGFIAAFVGGAVFGNFKQSPCKFLIEFMEAEGQILVLFTFAVFGASLLPWAFGSLSWGIVAYAILSLTVVRVLPVVLSLLGSGLSLKSMGFLGWFGPRGLASILFAVLLFEADVMGAGETILATVFLTVALSIVLHGVSALPAARSFAKSVEDPMSDPGA